MNGYMEMDIDMYLGSEKNIRRRIVESVSLNTNLPVRLSLGISASHTHLYSGFMTLS